MESGTMEARRLRAKIFVNSTTEGSLISSSVTNPENLDPHQRPPTEFQINPVFGPRTYSPSWVNTTLETCFQTYPHPAYQLSPAFRPRAHSSGSSSGEYQAPPFHPYQCQVVRPRTYSTGSSSGKVPPEYAEWSSPGGTQDLGYEGLSNSFQSGLNMDPQPVERFHVESYMVPSTVNGDISLGCQYTINVSQVERPRSLALPTIESVEDINDISVETMRTPLECDVEEIIKHELNIEGTLDFN
ncbi:hypothetical protein JTB14_005807 [Gonioctena quinquepunctata]|nr:hypothetical protein JTB14_005807 [Gonioctena quinquepunctata]